MRRITIIGKRMIIGGITILAALIIIGTITIMKLIKTDIKYIKWGINWEIMPM